MKWKLGIDTGGSYTDAVLVDCDTGTVIRKAKAATTKEDLTVGIESAINQLEIKQMENICLVCLSTTLATNAVVEGKGACVGLITINEPESRTYPAAYKYNVTGKINVNGCEVSPLDMGRAQTVLTSMKGNIEALAISGYASVRNPIYEHRLKELSDEILGVPAVCAHELTNVLGYYERTVTAVLNAKLIPVIKELIAATKHVLRLKGIGAPLVIIKGDGNCMVDSFARERPIETVLSGPAASALGGMTLSSEDSMIVADMGGTTLDVVPILDRIIPIEPWGAVVGNWRTRVKAMHTRSFGLGGDSYIRMDNMGALSFGPDRTIPLCEEAEKNPALVEEIKNLSLCSEYHIIERQEVDCLALLKISNVEKETFDHEELEIIKLLKEKSHSLLYLSQRLNKDIDALKIKGLLDADIVQLVSLTPTDLLHATGEYVRYNQEIAQLAVKRMADRKKMETNQFVEHAKEAFVNKICSALVESLLLERGIQEEHLSEEIIHCVFSKSSRLSGFSLQLNVPIVGIGAPAGIWLKKAAEKLGCRVVIPKDSEVANAVGTVSGDIRESLEALIQHDSHTKKYIAYLPNTRTIFATLDEAVAATQKELILCGKAFAEKLGVRKYNVRISQDKAQAELKMKATISAEAKNIYN